MQKAQKAEAEGKPVNSPITTTEKNQTQGLRTLLCVFKGTSGDLLFWAMIDTLFLSTVKGYSAEQISLLFSLAFWGALILKYPCYRIARALKVGTTLLIGTLIFLCSAVTITFSRSFWLIAVGQCLYIIAPDFFSVSDILLRDVCSRTAQGDFLRCRTFSSSLYAALTLLAALFVNPLMKRNAYLPMYLCIGMRGFSLILALILLVRSTGINARKEAILPGAVRKTFLGTGLYCLAGAVLFGTVFSLANTYTKLLLQDDLERIFDSALALQYFSWAVIGTRIAKLLGNFLFQTLRRKSTDYHRMTLLLSGILVLVPVFTLSAVLFPDTAAFLPVGAGLILLFLVYDPMLSLQRFLLINKLDHAQSVAMLFAKSALSVLMNALFSSAATLILLKSSLNGVVVLILLLIICMAFCVFMNSRRSARQSADYARRWQKEIKSGCDSLTFAAAALMVHYRAVSSPHFSPSVLRERAAAGETGCDAAQSFGCVGSEPYFFERMYKRYSEGYPCAVLVRTPDREEAYWCPLLYADADGGVVCNAYSEVVFLSDFETIREYCWFEFRK